MTIIQRASRNAVTLRWFASCELSFRHAMRCLYSADTGMPECELDSAEVFIQDPDVLNWAAARFAGTIALFGEDEL